MNALTPELYPALLEYVRDHGVTQGAEVAMPVPVKRADIQARLTPESEDFDPRLLEQVMAAKADYDLDKFHPSKDKKLKAGVIKAIRMMVESGQSTVTTDKDERGAVIKTRETVKAGIPSWVYYAVFPPDGVTIDAMKAAVASQTAYLVKHYSDGITREAYETITAFLRAYLFDQIDTRMQAGQPVGTLGRLVEQRDEEMALGDGYRAPTGIYGEEE